MMKTALWTGGAIVCLAGLLLFGFGANNPNPFRWSVFSGLVVCFSAYWCWRGSPIPKDWLTVLVVGFVLYAALSLLWSADWREGIVSLYELVLLASVGLSVRYLDRRKLSIAVPLVATAAAWATLIISASLPATFGGLGNENFQAEFLVMFIPFALAGLFIMPGRTGALMCLVGTLLLVAQAFLMNDSDAKWMGLAGIAGLLLSLMLIAKQYKIAVVVLCASCLALWRLWSPEVARSVFQRFELTIDTLFMWLDRPIFGGGIGSFNYLYPLYQEEHLRFVDANALWSVALYAGASHNEFAQALAVFGIVGVALIAGIAVVIAQNLKLDAIGIASVATLSILAGLSLVGFPTQNPSTGFIAAVAAGIAVDNKSVPIFNLGHVLARLGGFRRSLHRRRTAL